jgi:hypothetical protein
MGVKLGLAHKGKCTGLGCSSWCKTILPKEKETGRKLHIVGFRYLYCLVSKYYMGEQIEKIEMVWECGTLGRVEVHMRCWRGNLKERDNFENQV